MPRSHRFLHPSDAPALRLDQCMASSGLISRRQARVLLDAGAVYHNGKRVKVASRMVNPGDTLEWYEQQTAARTETDLRLIFEDPHLVVVDKPAGMPVQPTRESARGTVLEGLEVLLGHTARSLHVVHRLDKETSGLLVLARHKEAAASLSEALRDRHIDRVYLAVLEGICPAQATWQHYLTPIQPHRDGPARVDARPLRGQPRPLEKEAILHLTRLHHTATHSLVAVVLETGRTHQIRAQCGAEGFPVMGDTRYGATRPPLDQVLPLALHAAQLSLTHPQTGIPMRWTTPFPRPLLAGLTALSVWPVDPEQMPEPFNTLIKEISHGEAERGPVSLPAP